MFSKNSSLRPFTYAFEPLLQPDLDDPVDPLYQLQDNGYTKIWAPILFAVVIGLSLIGILVPLWEFLFKKKYIMRQLSVVSLSRDNAELEHVSEMNRHVKMEFARLLDKPVKGRDWRDLAQVLGYQYEIKGRANDAAEKHEIVSPTISLLERWQFTNTATIETLLKSLYSIERNDCADVIEVEYNLIIECLSSV